MGKGGARRRGAARAQEDAAAAPTPSRAERIEQQQRADVLRGAVAKQNRGEKLTAGELRALKQWEADENRRRGLAFVRAVPKSLYQEWSGGRQVKVLNDQADLYGAPLRGATVDLVELVRWLHDWLGDNKHELAIVAKGEASAGAKSGRGELVAEQVEQLKKRNQLLELRLDEAAGDLMPRAAVHELLTQMATLLRTAGHRLYQQCGDKAGDILAQAIEDFSQLVERVDDGGNGEPSAV